MDGSGPVRPRPARLAGGGRPLAVAAVLVLLGVAAIGSSGRTPGGAGGARRPTDGVLDAFLSVFLVLLGAGSVVAAVLYVLTRGIAAEQRARYGRSALLPGLLVAVGVVVALALLVRYGGGWRPFGRDGQERDGLAPGGAGGGDEAGADAYDPQFALAPVLVVVGLLALGVAAWWTSRRRRQDGAAPAGVALVLADVLEETLDDLRGLGDPRAAVIACYARLERALAAVGLPRLPAEAPGEYLGRILDDLDVGAEPAARLTGLYARADFSRHDVPEAMRDDAIDALAAVRDALRAAEERRERELRRAFAAADGETAA